MNWIKYLVIIIFFAVVIVFISLISVKNQTNKTSTQEINFNLSTVSVGDARVSLNGSMDKKAVVPNLLLKVAESQKKHDHNTKISYVFLDDNGRATVNNDDIKSVQFKVELLNKKGEVETVSKERIEIDALTGGDN
ncbi:hypothetical protein WMZ97_16665 [Lentibacillus sp. N15]|uniref:hypothetical protein n=1 Tax=Lentibacillus songyuanensis TaxID=3136161 RepID=UPI0031BB50F6